MEGEKKRKATSATYCNIGVSLLTTTNIIFFLLEIQLKFLRLFWRMNTGISFCKQKHEH